MLGTGHLPLPPESILLPSNLHVLDLVAAAGRGGEIDYLEIVMNSGLVVGGVLALLLAASVVSWAIILKKWMALRKAQAESARFLEVFWQSKRLDAIYQAAEELPASPIAAVFRAGYVELSKVTAQKKGPEGAMAEQLGGIENVERALKRAAVAEVTRPREQVMDERTAYQMVHLMHEVATVGTGAGAAKLAALFLAQSLDEPQVFDRHPLRGADKQNRLLVQARWVYRLAGITYMLFTVENRDPAKPWMFGRAEVRLDGAGDAIDVKVLASASDVPLRTIVTAGLKGISPTASSARSSAAARGSMAEMLATSARTPAMSRSPARWSSTPARSGWPLPADPPGSGAPGPRPI